METQADHETAPKAVVERQFPAIKHHCVLDHGESETMTGSALIGAYAALHDPRLHVHGNARAVIFDADFQH